MASTELVDSWIACRRPPSVQALRLFCFPHAGGSAQAFRLWQSHLPTIDVCPVQPPGRGARLREPPLTSVVETAQLAATALQPLLDAPFAVYGHSLGALTALEFCRHLRRERGVQPVHLFVGSRRAPELPAPTPHVHGLPVDEFLEAVGTRYGAIPQAILAEKELLELLLPALRADLRAFETYAYKDEAPFGSPVSVFGGDTDPMASRQDLEQWRAHTTGQFSLHMLSGGHLFFVDDPVPLLRMVAAALGEPGSH